MRCHAPAEDVEEDDDRQFLAAAREDTALAAHLLLRLSGSEACSTPWRRQLRHPSSPSAAGAGDDLPLPDPPKWGQRRPRTRCLTADGVAAEKREEARRSSPTTPLSWSGGGGGGGGSSTSGSVSESTPPHRPPKRRRDPDSPSRHDVAQPSSPQVPATAPTPEPDEDWGDGPAPPCKWKGTEAAACHGGSAIAVLVAAAPAAVGSASLPGSTKAVATAAAAVGVPPRAAAHVEPLRPRLTGEGTSSVAVRRPAKKKTVPELKALNQSLLQEQVALRKDLEEQKKIFEALLEENFRLKSLEASLGISRNVGEPTVSNRAARRRSETEVPAQPRDDARGGSSTAAERPDQRSLRRGRSPPNPEPRRALPLFDLNCLPDDGLL